MPAVASSGNLDLILSLLSVQLNYSNSDDIKKMERFCLGRMDVINGLLLSLRDSRYKLMQARL